MTAVNDESVIGHLPHAGQAPSDRDRRIPSLDGLRAISIVLVLLSHAVKSPGVPETIARSGLLFALGNLGVRVFFVISGFLITGLLLREREQTGGIALRAFYMRRAFRIVPAYATFLLALAVAVALGWIPSPGRSDILHALTYTVNYKQSVDWNLSHFWSLAVEEQFYLIWPLTLMWLCAKSESPRAAARVVAAYLVLAPVIRLGIYAATGSPEYVTWAFETVADAIAIGCLLALWQRDLAARAWYRRLLASRWLALVPLIVLATSALVDPHPRLSYALGISTKNVGIALIVAWAVQWRPTTGRRLHRVLNSAPLVYVGVLSYSLYVWQQPFFDARRNVTWHRLPWNVLGALAMALLSYYLVERPFLRLRVRLQRRTSAQRPLTSPSVDAAA